MINALIETLLFAGVVALVAWFLPGIRLKNFATAIWVALVYSLLHLVFHAIFGWLALPFVVITLGLFYLVINTALLWATDQFIDDFEIESLQTTFIAAVLLTVGKVAINAIV